MRSTTSGSGRPGEGRWRHSNGCVRPTSKSPSSRVNRQNSFKGPSFAAGALSVLLLLTGCGQGGPDSDMAAAQSRAAEMAASVEAEQSNAPAPSSSPPKRKESTPTPTPTPDPEPQPTLSPPPDQGQSNRWATFPWGSNGLECPHPLNSPGATRPALDSKVVVLLGDSLIRDARSTISAQLQARGFQPIFVCWGGKNLEWGSSQISTMRSLNLIPRCLVINLGTNDLKGTTAQGLADAVNLNQVQDRLTRILTSVSDIDNVFTVDISAEPTAAPSTMAQIQDAPATWRNSVTASGVGAVIPWSSYATPGSGLTSTTPGDGVHDTTNGISVRANLIAAAVADNCG